MGWLTTRRTTPPVLALALLVGFGVILACAVGAGALLKLAERPDGSTPFDSSITTWVVAHRVSGLTTLAHAFSTVGSQAILIPVTAIVAVALTLKRRLVLTGLLVASWGGALLQYNLIKHFVQRMRPPMEIWLTNVGRTTSFPSGHATQSLATFVALALVAGVWLSKTRGAGLSLALVLALGVGWSRVYLGVHWTTDVLAGWLVAAAWLALVVLLARSATAIRATRSDP